MQLNCRVEERVSEKTGKKYYILIVDITDTYKKIIFLTRPEIELIKLITRLD